MSCALPIFLAMLLALAAGLRRAEIDSLAWYQIDFERALIRVEATESGRESGARAFAYDFGELHDS